MRKKSRLTSVVVALSTIVLSAGLAGAKTAAAQSSLPIFNGNTAFSIDVESYEDRRFARVVRQQYDFSCGAAAVATLLTYHYEQATPEAVVFEEMFHQGDQALIQQNGFSLHDMQSFLQRRGYRANGYRVPLDKLVTASVPAITLINSSGYLHFVVVKGVTEQQVLVADPAFGNRILPREEFEAMWNGIVFVILDNAEMAQAFFNAEKDWQIKAQAPIGSGRAGQNLGAFTLNLPGPGFF